jgi:hypothetical protein
VVQSVVFVVAANPTLLREKVGEYMAAGFRPVGSEFDTHVTVDLQASGPSALLPFEAANMFCALLHMFCALLNQP